MKYFLALILTFSMQACNSNQTNDAENTTIRESASGNSLPADQQQQLHTVTVLEVIQVEKYTYLRVREGEKEMWIAVPTLEAKPQDVLYYERGMVMTDFESKELKRKFDKILFVDKVAKDKNELMREQNLAAIHESIQNNASKGNQTANGSTSSQNPVKQSLKIELPAKGISIATLLKNPKSYEGKSVIIRGKITKYTGGVMGKNWIHLQDGTAFNDKFEIVVTTAAELNEGDTVTFEGPITLNKDLGYGYFFEVLMENAKIIK